MKQRLRFCFFSFRFFLVDISFYIFLPLDLSPCARLARSRFFFVQYSGPINPGHLKVEARRIEVVCARKCRRLSHFHSSDLFAGLTRRIASSINYLWTDTSPASNCSDHASTKSSVCPNNFEKLASPFLFRFLESSNQNWRIGGALGPNEEDAVNEIIFISIFSVKFRNFRRTTTFSFEFD